MLEDTMSDSRTAYPSVYSAYAPQLAAHPAAPSGPVSAGSSMQSPSAALPPLPPVQPLQHQHQQQQSAYQTAPSFVPPPEAYIPYACGGPKQRNPAHEQHLVWSQQQQQQRQQHQQWQPEQPKPPTALPPLPPLPAAHPNPAPVAPVSVAQVSVDEPKQEQAAENDGEEWVEPTTKPYQARERVRRIHLPVREGMDDLSDEDDEDEDDWGTPGLAPGETALPAGYDGPRRLSSYRKTATDGKIKPSYYYPTESNATRGVPVFEPSYEDFRDFNSFIAKIDNYGMRSGIVKVVPPKEWFATLKSVSQPLKDTSIREPIEQHFMGSRGIFRQSNVASRRIYNIKQWKEMCETDKYATPDFFNARSRASQGGDGTERIASAPRRSTRGGAVPADGPPPAKRPRGRPAKQKKKEKEEENDEQLPEPSKTPLSESMGNADVDMDTLQNPEEHDNWEKKLNDVAVEVANTDPQLTVKEENTEPALGAPPSPAASHDSGKENVQATMATPARHDPVARDSSEAPAPSETGTASVTKSGKKRSRQLRQEELGEEWDKEWATFDYEALPNGAKLEDYTLDECKKIERQYWKRFSLGAPPMYGADGSGSLFDESVKDWNVACLDDLLMRINPHMPMPGVNTPYLYFGMWRATFAWHVEDADLYSINYIHFGGPKFWYSIPQTSAERFERLMASYFPHDQQKCPEFMRHKQFLVSPTNLHDGGIPLNRCVQFPGEIILTYPYGYHSGFNLGFNCAESINFATEGWLDIGRRTKACVCFPDTVRINVDHWLDEARQDAERIRKDPEYAERRKQERDAAVIIPQHEAKKRRILGPAYRPPQPVVNQPRMQPRATASEHERKPARPQTNSQTSTPASAGRAGNGHSANKAVRSVAGAKASPAASMASSHTSLKPAPRPHPCALCPEESSDGLVRIYSEKAKNRSLMAHKVCVTFTPTTWCAQDPATGIEMVYGFDQIESARWGLKCGLCDDKHGTKIQCTKSAKCVRAFHATCALKDGSGVVLDALVNGRSVLEPMLPGDAPLGEGTLQLAVTCRQHNPVWQRALAEKKRQDLADRIARLQSGSPIQIRASTGVWAVTLVANRAAHGEVEVQFGDGNRALCKYAAIVWPEDLVAESRQAAPAKPRNNPMERARSGQAQQQIAKPAIPPKAVSQIHASGPQQPHYPQQTHNMHMQQNPSSNDSQRQYYTTDSAGPTPNQYKYDYPSPASMPSEPAPHHQNVPYGNNVAQPAYALHYAAGL